MSDGLEGVIAAQTVLSDVDGAHGRLVIRGYVVEDLAGRTRFEDAAHLLLDGFFDDAPSDLSSALGEARVGVFAEVAALDEGLARRDPVEALRALLARIPDGDDLKTALRLIAAPAVFTPAVLRVANGDAPIAPDPALSHAADILRMIRGVPATDAEAAALDAYLVTVCDHGLNASTFAARVVASTRAGLTSAVLAGLSALKGPLHGGAPGPVIDMLDAIGTPENARPWLERALARGDRLMGFGHRIYRVRDPRADALKAAVRRLSSASGGLPGRLAFAEAVERAALEILREHKPDRPLDTNVEFYTALLLEALGLPPSSFTCVFAMGRVAGWLAHAREQLAGGRLIRPQSVYVGPEVRVAA
ncbi:citrate synthase/methylcitrate synthase [Caulobacter vibrioides]|uniref:citrate synthase/methylcitrate synthase n=1 Tax=Caulobacter vibrioides TaxID=155892 RepID=UPI000BB49528|nr:citrate synthase/methylcitrate synthase [Caulobacter vibrioides]ATC26536.1 citrate synthase/methylcitrate synthase [Caulobacter vibrioides]AZH14621.1 citrate synthase/methylcitrate synthase [Caulobacter vibrioides]PLR12360.1 citrate synthase/methylcitrate synthase [Caulobacter vibrioides]